MVEDSTGFAVMDRSSQEFAAAIRTPVDTLVDINQNMKIIGQSMPEFHSSHGHGLKKHLRARVGYCPDESTFISFVEEYVRSSNYGEKVQVLAQLEFLKYALQENSTPHTRSKSNLLGVALKRLIEPIEATYARSANQKV